MESSPVSDWDSWNDCSGYSYLALVLAEVARRD